LMATRAQGLLQLPVTKPVMVIVDVPLVPPDASAAPELALEPAPTATAPAVTLSISAFVSCTGEPAGVPAVMEAFVNGTGEPARATEVRAVRPRIEARRVFMSVS
jgi:hypothetical protein